MASSQGRLVPYRAEHIGQAHRRTRHDALVLVAELTRRQHAILRGNPGSWTSRLAQEAWMLGQLGMVPSQRQAWDRCNRRLHGRTTLSRQVKVVAVAHEQVSPRLRFTGCHHLNLLTTPL